MAALAAAPRPAITDRSSEFFSAADALATGPQAPRGRVPRTECSLAAMEAGRGLHAARRAVRRLQELSRSTSLFNDPGPEIEQLSVAVTSDLGRAAARADAVAASRAPSRHGAQHRDALAALLRADIQACGEAFRGALAAREASLTDREKRAARFASVAQPPSIPRGTASSLQRRPAAARRAAGARAAPSAQAGEVAIDLDSLEGGQPPPDAQQQIWTPRSLREREDSVRAMQSTLQELGSMFSRLTALVAEQGDAVRHIDEDVDAAAMDIGSAQAELNKFYRNMRGNRRLILVALAVVACVILAYHAVARRG
mmetsp:Transcript_14579/g.49351  ORF Transcript_14579/g.49351 Transcript_14579/m.49351 type:complete len:313 (+) Transcript_14579:76-1014(+)